MRIAYSVILVPFTQYEMRNTVYILFMRERIKALIKIIISVGLIVWLFSRIDVGDVVAMLRGANIWLVIAGMLLYTGAILCNAFKWGVLLRAQKIKAPWRVVVQYTFVGVFFNNFLPANVGGDVMRGYGLSEYIQRRADAAVSVVVDRLIGLMALSSMAAVSALVVFLLPQQPMAMSDLLPIAGIAVLATGGLATVIGLMLSRRSRALIGRLLRRFSFLEPLIPIYEKLSTAIGAYRHRADALALAYGIALGTWVFSNLTQWVLAQALSGEGIPLLYIFLINPIIGLALLIPISIGGLGVNQNLFPALYSRVGIPTALAVSVSLLLQLTIYVTSLPGGVLWWRQRQAREAQEGEGTDAEQVPANVPKTVT